MKNKYESNLWKAYLFKFLVSLHFITGILVPFLTDWGKISFFQVTLLQSFFALSVFLLEIPTGVIADYISRKVSLILAALITAIASIIYRIYPNFYLFLLAEFLWAMGVALTSGADQAFVYDTLKRINKEHKSKKVLGKLESYRLKGYLIAGPIGSILGSIFGLEWGFRLMCIPMILAAIVGLTFKEPKTKVHKESKRYCQILKNGIKYFKNHHVLKTLAFDSVSVSALVFFLIWIYQPVLSALNFPLAYFGFVSSAICAIQIFTVNNFSKFEKLVGSKKKYLFLSAILPGIGFILLALNSYATIGVTLIFLITIGLSRKTLFENYFHKHIESEYRATVLSTINMLDRLIRAIIYPLIGLVINYSLRLGLLLLGILTIIASLISKVEEEHLIE